MFILIESAGDSTAMTLEEPNDFRAFKVVISPKAEGVADQALARLGQPALPEHVFVARAAVETLADPAHREDPAWQAGLTAMADYAEKHGWTDDAGRIRAHIERAA